MRLFTRPQNETHPIRGFINSHRMILLLLVVFSSTAKSEQTKLDQPGQEVVGGVNKVYPTTTSVRRVMLYGDSKSFLSPADVEPVEEIGVVSDFFKIDRRIKKDQVRSEAIIRTAVINEAGTVVREERTIPGLSVPRVFQAANDALFLARTGLTLRNSLREEMSGGSDAAIGGTLSRHFASIMQGLTYAEAMIGELLKAPSKILRLEGRRMLNEVLIMGMRICEVETSDARAKACYLTLSRNNPRSRWIDGTSIYLSSIKGQKVWLLYQPKNYIKRLKSETKESLRTGLLGTLDISDEAKFEVRRFVFGDPVQVEIEIPENSNDSNDPIRSPDPEIPGIRPQQLYHDPRMPS